MSREKRNLSKTKQLWNQDEEMYAVGGRIGSLWEGEQMAEHERENRMQADKQRNLKLVILS